MEQKDYTKLMLEALTSENMDMSDDNLIPPEEIEEVMRLFNLITDVFIQEKTNMMTALKVLSALGDSLEYYLMDLPVPTEE